MSSPRTVLSATLALVPLLLLTIASAPTAGAHPSASRLAPTPQVAYATSAVEATNVARSREDLPALETDECLKGFAARQARAMANGRVMFHQDLGAIMRSCGLSMAAENVAAGYATGPDAVRGWLQSPGHRANILHRRYRLVAVAARADASGRWYTAQVFGRR